MSRTAPRYVKIDVKGCASPCTVTFTQNTLNVYISMVHKLPSEKMHSMKQQNPLKMHIVSKNEYFREEFIYIAMVSDIDTQVHVKFNFLQPRISSSSLTKHSRRKIQVELDESATAKAKQVLRQRNQRLILQNSENATKWNELRCLK